MNQTIFDIAKTFGLIVEGVAISNGESPFRVYKGVNQVFIGSEEAVRHFLRAYETERPGLYEGSMIGYKE